MPKDKSKDKSPYWIKIFLALLFGISSWSLYQIINQGSEDLLAKFGINNFYLQNALIILFAIIVISLIFRKPIKKTFRRIVG